jgi:polyisoprenoid-binding protein YceI
MVMARMKKLTIFCFLIPLTLLANSRSFDFKDPKGVNTIIFQLDALLESINGSAGGITGNILFDPDAPELTAGSILLDSASLRVDNPVLQEHMHGENWLDVNKFPKIEFALSRLEKITSTQNSIKAAAEGRMTIRNVTIKMTVPVELTYLPNLLEKRNKVPGDLLVVRSKFKVKRDDFGIRPGEYLDKVANEIEISINLAGACPNG